MKSLGIEDSNLYFKKKSDVINNNPKIKGQSNTFKNSYFFNKEISRNNLIEETRSEYLLKKQKLMLNYPCFTPKQNSLHFNYILNRPITHKNMRKVKSLTDFWSLRYDIDKENEEVYFLKKQNLSQVKNLIDETLKLRKKSKGLIYDKYLMKLEKKNLIRKNNLIRRDNILKTQEKINQLIEKVERRQKEKEFNKECKLRREIEQLKERKRIDNQNEIREKQKKWEIQNYEHMQKVENYHQKRHELAVNEYLYILGKGLQRYERIDERKNQMDIKSKKKNEERKESLIHYKIKNKEIEKNKRKHFEKRQENISRFYSIQKEIKKDTIQKKTKIREEKFKESFFNRLLNKSMEEKKRKELLDLMEKKEEIVENNKILKEKINEEIKLNNLLKSDEFCDNYIRQRNILNYKNKIKLQNMRSRELLIKNKTIKRKNSAKSRIERFDRIKINKDLMLEQVKQMLEEEKLKEPEQIYKKVFTSEEIKLLEE